MSSAESLGPSIAEVVEMPADDLLAELSDSKILKTLEITNEDLLLARTDSDLLETLRITYELLAALRESGVLEIFYQLPKTDQANFLRWVGMIDDPKLRQDRTDTFASALEESPLGPSN
jgi:hypothetical protein